MLGVVIIGRNEGVRFERCLRSVMTSPGPVVYVDSGSTDGSVAFARTFKNRGVEVVELDMTLPFTAARARNAGLARLLELAPATEAVQFVDGDCEVREGWLGAGSAALRADGTIGAVSGRLRERHPEASLFNRLADLEWDRPAGEEKSCGGNAMIRVEAIEKAGGFDGGLIAGEEPELCARMRAAGYRIVRLPDEMALHDLAMFTKKQWFMRARRHGYAILEVSYFKGAASRALFSRQIASALFWGCAWPVLYVACLFAWVVPLIVNGPSNTGLWVLLLTCVPIVGVVAAFGRYSARLTEYGVQRGLSRRDAKAYATLLWESKSAQFAGMVQFLLRRAVRGRAQIIDYRTAR